MTRAVVNNMTLELQQTIEEVYRVFNDVQKPNAIEGCPCCIENKGIDPLLKKPLKSLTPDELTGYASSVFLTVGSPDDFFYFLPRILEIAATEHSWWPGPEVILCAIKYSEFDFWPEHRKKTVFRFFDTVLNDLFLIEDSGLEIDSWICALGRLLSDVSPYLKRLTEHPKKLIEFYEANSEDLIEGDLRNNFWDDVPKTRNQVIAWFNSQETRDLIESTYGLK